MRGQMCAIYVRAVVATATVEISSNKCEPSIICSHSRLTLRMRDVQASYVYATCASQSHTHTLTYVHISIYSE